MQHKSFSQMNRERMARASSSKQQAPRSKDHGAREKQQATSNKRQASSGLTRVEGYYRMKNPLQVMRPTSRGPARAKTNKGERWTKAI